MNIYYNPEKFGLSVFGEADTKESYEFDRIVVWEDRVGNLWYAEDSGCSCPIPFEYIKPSDLLLLNQASLGEFKLAARKERRSANEVEELISRVERRC